MGERSNDRAIWLARYVMPHELALRRWLASRRFKDIDIDDVVQETYAVLAGLATVENIRSPQQYAFQTAYSIILAQLRRSRIVSITAVADLETMAAVADTPSPEGQAGDREELLSVSETLKELPPRVRDVFVLRRIEGLSQREVAQRLGITENIVEKCVAQGVKALMTAFKRGGKTGADSPSDKRSLASESVSPAQTLPSSANKKKV